MAIVVMTETSLKNSESVVSVCVCRSTHLHCRLVAYANKAVCTECHTHTYVRDIKGEHLLLMEIELTLIPTR